MENVKSAQSDYEWFEKLHDDAIEEITSKVEVPEYIADCFCFHRARQNLCVECKNRYLCDKIKSELFSGDEKIKVTSADIIVHGNPKNPLFLIKYFDLGENLWKTDFVSRNLENVFNFLNEEFEIMSCSTCKHNVEFPPPHTCDVCASLDQPDFTMWEKKNGR